MTYFGPETFDFLDELEENNERAWFDANKKRYEQHVRDAAFDFIADFSKPLHRISREFNAIPKAVGGSLFRIYRDVRFSKDKRPYKTHVGIHFRHRMHKDAHAPGFYLHLEPGNSFAGIGIWRPDPPNALKIRQAIAAPRSTWGRAVGGAFGEQFELSGESLKRPPRGFDAEHRWIDDLKRKSFIGVHNLDDEDVLGDELLDEYVDLAKAGAPLVRFLCRALELPY